MPKLINVKLKSTNDGSESFVEAKGYEKIEDNKHIIYFSSDHKYKFIIDDESIEVDHDESHYSFKLNDITEGTITSDDLVIKVKISTKKMEIKDNYLFLEYELNFGGFSTNNQITLELH